MASELDDLFGGMVTSTTSDNSDFFKPGLYLAKPKSFEYRQGYKGKSFIAKFEILESNNDEIKVGTTRSWIVKLDGSTDQKKMAMGDIKGLIFALLGTSASEVGSPEKNPKAHEQAATLWRAAVDETFAKDKNLPGNALIGLPVKLEAVNTTTKKGADFTRHNWSPAPRSSS